MRLVTILSAAALTAGLVAPAAMAQSSVAGYISPTYGAQPLTANPASPISGSGRFGPTTARKIDTGLLVSADAQTRSAAYAILPRVQQAVAVAMNADQPRLSALRVGQYVTPRASAMVICGVAERGQGSARFLARPTVATLETDANRPAFEAGWRRAGCNG
jgi:hypothetical protein